MSEKIRIGVVGCGAISGAYLGMAKNFPQIEMAACADMNMEAARKKAAEFNIPSVLSVEDLMKDKSIEVVLNLTIPKAHVPVSLMAIEHGKHTYLEKPLGVTRADAQKLLAAAAKKGVRVGGAPDTFMGAGVQTARKLIDDGAIGRPVGFVASMLCPGHESWHPSPEFYYEAGGGPMLDMGPYYVTALLNLLGPVTRITGIATVAIPERTIGSEPKKGKKIHVETPDHITGLMEFDNGTAGTIQTSFAVRFGAYDNKNPITIFGTEGSLKVPDPNGFDGLVWMQRTGEKEFTEMPHTFVKGYGRSVGLADMAIAARSGRPHRCSAEQAMATLDVMEGFLDASKSGQTYTPVTKYTRPAPMPAQLPFGQLD